MCEDGLVTELCVGASLHWGRQGGQTNGQAGCRSYAGALLPDAMDSVAEARSVVRLTHTLSTPTAVCT